MVFTLQFLYVVPSVTRVKNFCFIITIFVLNSVISNRENNVITSLSLTVSSIYNSSFRVSIHYHFYGTFTPDHTRKTLSSYGGTRSLFRFGTIFKVPVDGVGEYQSYGVEGWLSTN